MTVNVYSFWSKKNSLSRNDNHLHFSTIRFQQNTFNNTICLRPNIQLHYYATISVKVTILNAYITVFSPNVKGKQSLQLRNFLCTTQRAHYSIRVTCSDSSICSEMPRRNRIPFEHRERIVRTFEDVNKGYLLVADTLGINRSTASRKYCVEVCKRRQNRGRPRGGPNHVRVDNEMRDCLSEILNKNCVLS